MKIVLYILLIISVSSCGLTSKKINDCDFNNLDGDEFVLRQAEGAAQQTEMYHFFNVPAKGWENQLNYKKYVNRHGKVYKMPPKEEFPSWAILKPKSHTPFILDTCEILYAPNHKIYQDNKLVTPYIENAYFLKDIEKAKKIIGKKVWKKRRGYSSYHKKLLTPVDGEAYYLNPYDDLEVIGIDKNIYKKSLYVYAPFHLKVKDKLGNEGIVLYSSKSIFLENPISDDWEESIVKSIKKGSVLIGMTKRQADLAWGRPKDINRTTTANIRNEQWVYGNGSFLYFDNGILSAIQN